ncbi:hypothetical protein KIL84_012300 [Mauremys mutica]|uniref:Uncharacterized protein n=1 Tax=Mauremys mutica TaxID=74926 RepID=A0A9D3XFV5_9SAUR|nr:hypothetical protein KIL84_012300 [Mauremys mutica]
MEPLYLAFAGWLSLTLSGAHPGSIHQPASRAAPLTAIPGESQSQQQNRNAGPLLQKSASYPSPSKGAYIPHPGESQDSCPQPAGSVTCQDDASTICPISSHDYLVGGGERRGLSLWGNFPL